MRKPDYDNSIVNLMASLVRALGGEEGEYPSLAVLDHRLPADRPLVLLIVDGLGDHFLQGRPESFLARQRQGCLSSVFTPTTATAITSFFTGVAPQQHAITGWHTYFRELGAVVTVLPFAARYGGACLAEAGISPARLVGQASLFDRLAVPCHAVLPQLLVDSAYSRLLCGRASRHGFTNLDQMFATIEELAAAGGSRLIIAYWSELDSLAHTRGMASPEVAAHFQDLDAGCRQSLSRLTEAGATVVVTADHGLIDTGPQDLIMLEDHPQLAAMLSLPLCGEPRCASCYVRAGSRGDFEAYVEQSLGHACELHRTAGLIEQGYWGRGPVSPRLPERLGDYILVMKGNYIIKDRLINDKEFHQVGVHGGLSGQELYVPLIIVG